MVRRVKKKDGENLSSANIRKVIGLLHPTKQDDKPITKKEACEILNIAYNTTRLDKIIADYQERIAYTEKRKKMNRGKPASQAELAEAVAGYLRGDSISEIAKSLYRSSAFVKNIIETIGVPSRLIEDPTRPDYLPDACVAESFEEGEVVWCATHHSAAIIEHELSIDYQAERSGFKDVNYEKKYGSKCYAVWVLKEHDQDGEDMWARVSHGGYRAYAAAYDLGSLRHLKELGIDLRRL